MKDLIFAHGGFLIEKKYLWFVPYEYDFVCKYNLEDEKIEKIKLLGEPEAIDTALNIVRFQDELITIPSRSKVLHIYDDVNGAIKNYELEENISSSSYLCTANYNGYLYLFPFGKDHIVKLKTTPNIDVSYIATPENGFVMSAQIENRMYLVANSNKIYCYDLKLDKLSSVVVPVHKISCIAAKNKNELTLVDTDGNIYLYYLDKHMLNRVDVKVEHCNSVAYVNNKLFAFPMLNPNGFYIIDIDAACLKFVNVCNLHEKFSKTFHAFSQTYTVGNQIYVMNLHMECLLGIDACTEKIVVYDIDLNTLSAEEKSQLRECEEKRMFIIERKTGYRTLDNFIHRIMDLKG